MQSSQLRSRFRIACREEKALSSLMVNIHELLQPREEFNSGRGKMQEIFSTKKKAGKFPRGHGTWGSSYWQSTIIAVPAWVGKQEINEVQPRRKVVENYRRSWREGLTVQEHSKQLRDIFFLSCLFHHLP